MSHVYNQDVQKSSVSLVSAVWVVWLSVMWLWLIVVSWWIVVNWFYNRDYIVLTAPISLLKKNLYINSN